MTDQPDARARRGEEIVGLPTRLAPDPKQFAASLLNPGSLGAQRRGCICPVMDNCHGKFPPVPPTPQNPDGGWVIFGDCPMHGWEEVS